MTKEEIEALARLAREKCPACKEDVPVKGRPTGGFIHLDLFATAEAGAWYPCDAEKELEQVIIGWDDKHNPIYREGWEELMSELWDADPEIWEEKGDEQE